MIDLMIPLSGDKSAPYYEQIYCFIKKAIQTGEIQPGERLPSTRRLSAALGVSRSTSQLAYDQLTAEGYLAPRRGSGYYAEDLSLLYSDRTTEGEVLSDGQMIGPGKTSCESVSTQTMPEQPIIDFSPRGIDLAHFPFNTWRKLSREVLQEENRELFTSGEPRGEWKLRRVICEYLHSSRGMECEPSQIVVGAGSEYLLMILTQILGLRCIAMENPTHRKAVRVLSHLGHRLMPIDMDHSGIRTEPLRTSDADLVYVMPSHQYPTGVVMPMTRRQEILQWSLEGPDRYIIEDDYDSEFRYRGRPIPALWGADRAGRVIYMGTFSKSVAPAIRVSYMVLPKDLNELYEKTCGFYSATVSRVDQEILYRFMSGGYFERHLNRMRAIYRGKHDCLMEELEPLRGRFRISGELSGLHVLLESMQDYPEEALVAEAKAQGVIVYGMSSCLWEERKSSTIMLGYANCSEEEIREGILRLKNIWI